MIPCKRIKFNRKISIESRRDIWSYSGQPQANEYWGSVSKGWAKSVSGGELGKSCSRSGRQTTLCSRLMKG